MADSDPEDNGILGAGGAMNPDHPLLARAQNALKKQLLTNKQRLEEELREKKSSLQAAKQRRENIGVELYGFQQSLAKLQLQLETTHQNYQAISNIRAQAEEELVTLRANLNEKEGVTKEDRAKVEKHQMELDRLAATLKQVEAYNEEMKSEIAATRRAAYAAEGAVQKLEREKLDQDLRIDTMQESMKAQQQQLELHTAQLSAQKRETRAAMETLAEAEAEMESVHFEKKQLVAQWKSSLLAIQKRDEALTAIQDAIRDQQQQDLSIQTEITGYKKDIVKQQIQNEALTSVLKKVEAESQFLSKQIETCVEKQQRLQDVFSKLAKSLEHTEVQIKKTQTEFKALSSEQDAVDKAHQKVVLEIRSIDDDEVATLSQQTTAEKSTNKTAKDIMELRKKVREEELQTVDTQNELAKLQVDILNTEAHNKRLEETMKLLEEELTEKSEAIDKYEVEIKRRNDEIEKKTREIDMLNRKYERAVGKMEDEDTGPLEAVIKNLGREIETKGLESKDLQRRWIGYQTELVALQNDNSALAEAVTRMRSEHTILFQKKRRLEAQFESQQKEIRNLNTGMGRLDVELQRINRLIADNSSSRQMLQEDNFNLEHRVMGDLKDMEMEAAKVQTQIDAGRISKRDQLSEIVEVERQIMLWERKIQLEKEMHEVMDPTVGQDVVGEMKKEIHRMQLRHEELMRLQEKLIQDLEKALSKRDTIGMKGRATVARAKNQPKKEAALTRQQLDKAVNDLQKSIRDTEREIAETDGRLNSYEAGKAEALAQIQEIDSDCAQMREQEESVKMGFSEASLLKYKLLLATARQQKTAKRLEDMETGRHRPLLEDPDQLEPELEKATNRMGRVISLLEDLKASMPELSPEFDKILCHVAEF
eukprot:gene1679-33074_t